tara:strand:- start:4873 stop:5676 length:804 start_codon:yes stop_codon:yes gene_type:complete
VRYLAVGTGKVHIGSCRKAGSSSLQFLVDSNESVTLKRYDSSFRDNIFVLLLRDVEERWKSGTITDCPYEAIEYVNYTHTRWGEQQYFVGEMDKDGKVWLDDNFLAEITKHHSVTSDLSWMLNDLHTKFWEWNTPSEEHPTDISLLEFSKFENIYFLELKDLSNPKFLKWLQERDSEWECIEEIPHKNPSVNIVEPDMQKKFKEGYDNFWNSYQNGKILKDKVLVNPFFDLPGNDLVDEFKYKINLVKNEQLVVDDIRENHKNYIRF